MAAIGLPSFSKTSPQDSSLCFSLSFPKAMLDHPKPAPEIPALLPSSWCPTAGGMLPSSSLPVSVLPQKLPLLSSSPAPGPAQVPLLGF